MLVAWFPSGTAFKVAMSRHCHNMVPVLILDVARMYNNKQANLTGNGLLNLLKTSVFNWCFRNNEFVFMGSLHQSIMYQDRLLTIDMAQYHSEDPLRLTSMRF